MTVWLTESGLIKKQKQNSGACPLKGNLELTTRDPDAFDAQMCVQNPWWENCLGTVMENRFIQRTASTLRKMLINQTKPNASKREEPS